VNTAKIINFSFCSQSPRHRNRGDRDASERKNFPLPTKLNFVELVAGKWSE
jgi:hypothetical protein